MGIQTSQEGQGEGKNLETNSNNNKKIQGVKMTQLKSEDKSFYESTLKEAKKKIEIIDASIEEELARVKEKINQLQEQKKAVRQIYDGACVILEAKNEFEEEEKSSV